MGFLELFFKFERHQLSFFQLEYKQFSHLSLECFQTFIDQQKLKHPDVCVQVSEHQLTLERKAAVFC